VNLVANLIDLIFVVDFVANLGKRRGLRGRASFRSRRVPPRPETSGSPRGSVGARRSSDNGRPSFLQSFGASLPRPMSSRACIPPRPATSGIHRGHLSGFFQAQSWKKPVRLSPQHRPRHVGGDVRVMAADPVFVGNLVACRRLKDRRS